MFFAYDVIYLIREDHIVLVYKTIFTSVIGATGNRLPHLFRHTPTHAAINRMRACALAKAMRCSSAR